MTGHVSLKQHGARDVATRSLESNFLFVHHSVVLLSGLLFVFFQGSSVFLRLRGDASVRPGV